MRRSAEHVTAVAGAQVDGDGRRRGQSVELTDVDVEKALAEDLSHGAQDMTVRRTTDPWTATPGETEYVEGLLGLRGSVTL